MAWLLPVLVACYAPSAPSGAPCGPAGAAARCPAGLVCSIQGGAEVCVLPGTAGGDDAAIDDADAGVDGPPGDVDNDGVPNATDVCPNKPDPLQYDEDGDGVGDACDPCPVSSNNVDEDGDGVGNDCDPNPTTIGDRIAFFDGFRGGLPAGWTATGNWTAMTGDVLVSVGPDVDAVLQSPFTADATSTVIAAFVSGANVPVLNSGFGVAHAAAGEGVLCGLISEQTRRIALIDLDLDDFLTDQTYAWASQTAYIIGQIRNGAQYMCYSVDSQGAARSAAASHGEVPSPAQLQLRSRGISGRFLWVLHVDSP